MRQLLSRQLSSAAMACDAKLVGDLLAKRANPLAGAPSAVTPMMYAVVTEGSEGCARMMLDFVIREGATLAGISSMRHIASIIDLQRPNMSAFAGELRLVAESFEQAKAMDSQALKGASDRGPKGRM